MKSTILLGVALMFAVGAKAQTNNYTVTSVVTKSQDSRLANPWGLSHPPKNHHKRNEWWVADEVSGAGRENDAGVRPETVTEE